MHPFASVAIKPGFVAIHWFEHSSFAVKDSAGMVTMIDPFFPQDRSAETYIHPQVPVDVKEFPVNYILLTHDHIDHTHPETLKRIHAAWPEVRIIGPRESINRALSETCIRKASSTIVTPGDVLQFGTMILYPLYSNPPGGDPKAGIQPSNTTSLSYVLEISGRRLYFSGDSIRTLAHIDGLVRPLKALAPEIGFLSTQPTTGGLPTFEESILIAMRIGISLAIPSHYGCFIKRTYDPRVWAARFPKEGPLPLIIQHNSYIIK